MALGYGAVSAFASLLGSLHIACSGITCGWSKQPHVSVEQGWDP